ncbi:MAG: IPExxxVDY family protein [Bacteroidales bacterium]|nr:IPExxxVDY family protein [Bacteroidales bacterium]
MRKVVYLCSTDWEPMATKKKIQIASFDDVKILGISTTHVDYMMAWHLNKNLNLHFARYDDFVVGGVGYAFFYYSMGERYNVFNLVALKRKDQTWLRLSPRVDYLLVIRNEIDDERLEALIKSVRLIPEVTYAFLIDTSKADSLELYLELIELHEIGIHQKLSPTPLPSPNRTVSVVKAEGPKLSEMIVPQDISNKTLAETRTEVMKKRSSLTEHQTAQ